MTYQVNLMRTFTNTLPMKREEEEREGDGEGKRRVHVYTSYMVPKRNLAKIE